MPPRAQTETGCRLSHRPPDRTTSDASAVEDPPLAAAATECRLQSLETRAARKETTGSGHHPCVRLHGTLIVNYLVRAVGSSSTVPKLVHKDPPRPFDKLFYLYQPDTFFRSYRTCIEIIHQMLAQTPAVGEFDLAADNWDDFLPHDLATFIVGGYRRATDQNMGVAPPYGSVDVFVTVRVNAVYSEPRALLLTCKQVTAAHCRFMVAARGVNAGTSECCVCMEDLAAHEVDGPDALMLPCSHAFHVRCLLPWFHRRSTCPMCRRDMMVYLVAATKTPKGKFPGQEARVVELIQ